MTTDQPSDLLAWLFPALLAFLCAHVTLECRARLTESLRNADADRWQTRIHVGGGTAGARALRRPMARSVAAARTYGKQFQCLTGKSAVFSFAFIAPEQMRLALLQKYRC